MTFVLNDHAETIHASTVPIHHVATCVSALKMTTDHTTVVELRQPMIIARLVHALTIHA